jgi:hypothetical protein
MNPNTNKFEKVSSDEDTYNQEEANKELLKILKSEQRKFKRADGSPVPEHWPVFELGEHIVIKDYTFKVAYVGETSILFEPIGTSNIKQDR